MIVYLKHPSGRWAKIDTEEEEVIDGDGRIVEALDAVAGTQWRPGMELEKVTLDMSSPDLAAMAIERASHFSAQVPTTGWQTFTETEEGTLLPWRGDNIADPVAE